MKVDRITNSRDGHSKFSKMAGGRILDLVQSEVDPFDPPSSKTYTLEPNMKWIWWPVAETCRGGSATRQMGGQWGAIIPARGRGPQYAAELRILLVYLSESLGRLGQNGGGGALVDLQVGSSKSTWVNLGLPTGVKSVCSSVTVEIFWRRRSHYNSFQVDLTTDLAPNSSLIQVIRGYRWVWANRAICNIFQ